MKILKLTFLLAAVALFASDFAAAQDTGSISGVVFNDDGVGEGQAGNGQVDPGETVEEGVVVNLVDSNGAIVATVTTGPTGAYQFLGIPQGDYTVQFTYPTAPPMTVTTAVISIGPGNLNVNFNAPVVQPTNGFDTTSPNLSVVNPASVRGPGVSPFTP